MNLNRIETVCDIFEDHLHLRTGGTLRFNKVYRLYSSKFRVNPKSQETDDDQKDHIDRDLNFNLEAME